MKKFKSNGKKKILAEKTLTFRNGNSLKVTLEHDGMLFVVRIGKDVFKETANELFAVQAFQAI